MQPPPADPNVILTPSPDRWMEEIGSLLCDLENASEANVAPPPLFSHEIDNQLVQVRLGIASSLFAALQCKNVATARHALRVSLNCSAWAMFLGMESQQRDMIEVASLLHDVGMIGVPDKILLKPGRLDADERAVVASSRHMSREILRHSCSSPEILDIVEHVPAWYDSSLPGFRLRGPRIPLGARMIMVAEAFDAMTTEHIYRPAMSQERALVELFDCAGRQFDPKLVEQFAEFQKANPAHWQRKLAARWLQSLDEKSAGPFWQLNTAPAPSGSCSAERLFQSKLLDSMYDAVVFVDLRRRITRWNHGAERLTGISRGSVQQQNWQPSLLEMADEQGRPISEKDCPAECAIRSGVQSLRRLTVRGRAGSQVAVDAHTIPVAADDGTTLGVVMIFHDASSETSLEERCQKLHEKATKDPLTQVANRAEFDRVFETFLAAHQRQRAPCSLLICDLDRFKQVNDTYGHQAGDQVIQSLANLLKRSCRPGDLAARYGGEEFVILYADCDNANAARRAEDIRDTLSQIAQPRMNGRPSTVSIGVTESQPGDTPEAMLRRADRALLMAKSQGRNTVVQLGSGAQEQEESTLPRRSFWPFRKSSPEQLLQRTLITPVPIKMAIEKLRGFVADHQARILAIEQNRVRIQVDSRSQNDSRRKSDRPIAFYLDLWLDEKRQAGEGNVAGPLHTRIRVAIAPRTNRDRRQNHLDQHAGEVLASLRAYLMAAEEETERQKGTLNRAKQMLAPWRGA